MYDPADLRSQIRGASQAKPRKPTVIVSRRELVTSSEPASEGTDELASSSAFKSDLLRNLAKLSISRDGYDPAEI